MYVNCMYVIAVVRKSHGKPKVNILVSCQCPNVHYNLYHYLFVLGICINVTMLQPSNSLSKSSLKQRRALCLKTSRMNHRQLIFTTPPEKKPI